MCGRFQVHGKHARMRDAKHKAYRYREGALPCHTAQVSQALGYTPPANHANGNGNGNANGGGGGGATDGYFWMEWRDFVAHFKEVTFCCT